jgi:hypothetical protein
LPTLLAGSGVKKSKQRAAKAASRKHRGKSGRGAPAVRSDATLPAWPSLAQLRDRVQSSAVVEADSYHFEQSLQ